MTRKLAFILIAALIGTATAGTTIIDDNFTDGDSAATGALEADWFTSSNTSAIETSAGSLGLVSGTSGRQIHGIFPTQTLANAGDMIEWSFTFTTPNTVADVTDNTGGNEDLRFGIFDHAGAGNPGGALFQDTSYSSGTPNADYVGIEGYMAEVDVETADTTTDIQIRRSDPSVSGRLLSTTGGFTQLGGTPDLGYSVLNNTTYTVSMKGTRDAAGGIDWLVDFDGNSNMVNDPSPGTYDFNMFGIGSSSHAFGVSATPGDPDNGIDISNATVHFCPVPEPSTAVLSLICGLFGLMGLRRRS